MSFHISLTQRKALTIAICVTGSERWHRPLSDETAGWEPLQRCAAGGGGGAKWPLGNMQLLPNSFKAARCQEGKKPGVEVDLKPCPDETGAVEPSPSLLRLPLPCFPYWDVAMPPRPPKWDCPDKSYCYLHRYLYNICFDCKSNK